jgi:two-component system, NarL family, nitrate/nitrite response regulator NarL
VFCKPTLLIGSPVENDEALSSRRKSLRIMIADDHELFNELITNVVLAHGLASDVVSCRNFDDAYQAVGTRKVGEDRKFDLIILDMRMPGMKGCSGLRRMLGIAGATPVAIISGMLSPAEAREVMREGAAGFLPKTMPLHALEAAVKALLSGERYVPPYLMVKKDSDVVQARNVAAAPGDLTSRERQVLDELMQGWSNKEIANNLGITEITVKSHLMHLFRKINARNRTDAVRIGLQLTHDSIEEVTSSAAA